MQFHYAEKESWRPHGDVRGDCKTDGRGVQVSDPGSVLLLRKSWYKGLIFISIYLPTCTQKERRCVRVCVCVCACACVLITISHLNVCRCHSTADRLRAKMVGCAALPLRWPQRSKRPDELLTAVCAVDGPRSWGQRDSKGGRERQKEKHRQQHVCFTSFTP